MTTPSSRPDTLVTILTQEKEFFYIQHRHLHVQEKERLWNERVRQLNAVLVQSNPKNMKCTASSPTSPQPSAVTMAQQANAPSPRRRSFNTDSTGFLVQSADLTSRKRSSGECASTERLSIPGSYLDFGLSASGNSSPLDDYATGNAAKMQRIPSGKKPVAQIQTYDLAGTDFANITSALNSAGPLAYGPSFPGSGSASSPGPGVLPSSLSTRSEHQHVGHGLPTRMSRQNSLTGSFTRQVASMNIKSPAEGGQHHGVQPSCGFGLAELSCLEHTEDLSHEELGPSASPIPIPSRATTSSHTRRPSVNGNSFRPLLSSQPPVIKEQASWPNSPDRHSPTNRPLAPRPSANALTPMCTSLKSSTSGSLLRPVMVVDANGMSTEKYQIAKLDRPKKQKEKQFFCTYCDKHSSGFRGAHELQRHFDAQHATVKKVWICVDGSQNQDKLNDCKWCMSQKTYPAYYNAAAHLRRIHFKPKPEGGKKGKTGRGGIGGGKHPPMEELKKYWMKQVELRDGEVIDVNEQLDLEMIDDEEMNIEDDLEVAQIERENLANSPHYAKSANEHLVPRLSTTIDTATSSCSEMIANGFSLNGSTPSDSATSPHSPAAFSYKQTARVTPRSNNLHPGYLSSICASSVECATLMASGDFDFDDVFPDLDLSLPQMPFEDNEF